MSAVGEVALTRRYWKCTCGVGGSYAADDLLGIEGKRYSKTVQKHCCRLAAGNSFASASENMHELLGVRLCPETMRKIVEGHGKAMARFQPEDSVSEGVSAGGGRGRIHDRRGQGEHTRRRLERPENRDDFQAESGRAESRRRRRTRGSRNDCRRRRWPWLSP